MSERETAYRNALSMGTFHSLGYVGFTAVGTILRRPSNEKNAFFFCFSPLRVDSRTLNYRTQSCCTIHISPR